MASVKALLGGGLAALCEHIKGIRTTVGDLAEATAQSVDEIDGILHEKQDINSKVAFTIPTTGWGTDSYVPQHPKFTNTQSYAGKFRLRAASVPTAAISAQYHIINTVKYTD